MTKVNSEAIPDNEAVYDEQLAPLMRQVIAVCKAHKIPMFATFVYKPDGFCTTSLPVDLFYPDAKDSEEAKALLAAYRAVRKPAQFAAFTVITTKATT